MHVPKPLSVRSVRRVIRAILPVFGSNFNGSDFYLLGNEVRTYRALGVSVTDGEITIGGKWGSNIGGSCWDI